MDAKMIDWKIRLEYPFPFISIRDKDVFDDMTMIDFSLNTTFHYLKNHDTGFGELLVRVLGFGFRISWLEEKGRNK